MNKLHLISQSITAEQLQAAIERYVSTNDSLLFIGDAVAALLKSQHQKLLSDLEIPVYALLADLKSRGISGQIPDLIHQCDDDKMVDLTLESTQVISW